jgi:hypothetical protein
MENQILWQPQALYQPGHSFSILLHHEFAREMYDSALSVEKYTRMQSLPKELMRFSASEPYIFLKNTCLISQINCDGGEGRWLSLDDALGGAEPDFRKSLSYSTHNLERATSSDVVTLMGLFDLWVEYSGLLKER